MGLHRRLLGEVDGCVSSGSPLDAPKKAICAPRVPRACAARGKRPGGARGPPMGGHSGGPRHDENLRKTLSTLRRTLADAGKPVLLIGRHTVVLDLGAVEVDVHLFERCLAEATAAGCASATALYRGDLLKDFHLREAAFTEWLIVERQRLRGLAIGVLESLLRTRSTKIASSPRSRWRMRLFAVNSRHEGPRAPAGPGAPRCSWSRTRS